MKAQKTLLFVCIVFLLLAGLCAIFPKNGILGLHMPSLHKVLVREKQLSLEEIMAQEEATKRLEEMQGICDSIYFYRDLFSTSDQRFWFPNDDPTYFDALFDRMEKAQEEGEIVRVIHYGDSQLEMDRLSDRLRAAFHKTYGGGGPGMLPFLQTIPSRSVSQWANGALSLQSSYGSDSLNNYRADGNYGLMARCYHVSGSASMGVKASIHKDLPESFCRFSTVTLVFNNTSDGPFSATLSSRTARITNAGSQTCSGRGVSSFTWTLDTCASDLNLSVQGTGDLYCVTVDDGAGVNVDNIALRGCSGQQFCMINQDQLERAYAQLNVGLIILQFGGNSVPYLKGEKSIEAYCTSIGKQIDRIHETCPHAKILFIGPSDMSTTINGERVTYPDLPRIVESLQKTANQHGAAFWSLYHAMGGYNTMRNWVDKGMASADYIHFSQKGANLMGDRLAESFTRMSDFYHLHHRLSKAQFDSIWAAEPIQTATKNN